MPQNKMASSAGAGDRISALPDALIHHVMSFLQAQEAVQTSVLSRRWRNLWKSMPVLRVTNAHPVQQLRKFLYHLLLLRDRSNMDVCLFDLGTYSKDDVPYVNLWIRHALLCQVQNLIVRVRAGFFCSFPLDNLPIVSQFLGTLELCKLTLCGKITDFSSCPALKYLKLVLCSIDTDKIYSRSLNYLTCQECSFPSTRIHVSAPNLISLQLIDYLGKTPSFEDMPVLVEAEVTFGIRNGADCCLKLNPGYGNDAFCDCEECYGIDDGSAGCVLLKGLSAARKLKLIAKPVMFILKRDLRWCPLFSRLDTLLLSEWCLADDHCPLICILQHAPVLKKLTLQLSTKEQNATNTVPPKAIYNAKEQSFALERLQRVEVKCHVVDQKVHKILKSLVTYGIPLEKISIIQQKNVTSERFSFVCTGFISAQS